jgi:hypothetical protein
MAYWFIMVVAWGEAYSYLGRLPYWKEALWSIPTLAAGIGLYQYLLQFRRSRTERVAFWKIAILAVIGSALVGTPFLLLLRWLGQHHWR